MSIRNQEAVFEEIYTKERWGKGKGSGTGSDPEYCRKYLEFLSNFIYENDIKSVLDIGCGDWQIYGNFDWSRIEYTGCDISQVALDLAADRTERKLLKVKNIEEISDLVSIVEPDLILIKDVMQHWTDDEIKFFLDRLASTISGWKYVITSNNWKFHRDPSKNGQPRILDRYSWAPIPVDFPAFVDFGFKPAFRYPKGGFKQVMIATRGEQDV